MKNFPLSLLIILAPLFSVAGTSRNIQIAKLDATQSKASWLSPKLTLCHAGSVRFQGGSFQLKNHFPLKGHAVLDLSRFTCKDSGADQASKSLDFLKIGNAPLARVELNSFERMQPFAPGGPNAIARGSLKVKGKTEPIEVRMVYSPTPNGFQATGKLAVELKKLGLSPAAEAMVEDPFEVELELSAHAKD